MLTLVTGATGLVGNNVVRLLLERGERVRVLVRGSSGSGSGARALEELPVEICLGDVTQAETVRQACRGVQRVVHAAAQVHIGWTGLEEQRAVNVGGTQNVVAAAAAEGARLLYVSTVNALGIGDHDHPADEEMPPGEFVPCPYVITKREAEQVVLEGVARGLDAVIVNPGFMLGPWDWKPSSGRMMLQVATGWAKLAPPGGNDVCDVRDVAAGILTALQRGQRGRRYILSGEYLSFLDTWRMFARIVGVKPPWYAAYPPGLWLYGHAGDLWGKLTGHEPGLNSAAVADVEARTSLFLRPRRRRARLPPAPANEAAESAWAWFREYGYA